MLVDSESRICFGLNFYDDLEEAVAAGDAQTGTYNGGFFDGMACGREPSFDRELPDGTKLYAVSTP